MGMLDPPESSERNLSIPKDAKVATRRLVSSTKLYSIVVYVQQTQYTQTMRDSWRPPDALGLAETPCKTL